MPAYRPRLPEVVAMIDAMPADVYRLQQVSGRSLAWTNRVLSRMVCDGILKKVHDVYTRVADVQPSYTLQVVEALQAGPMLRTDICALGIDPKSASAILATLERRGMIEVDSSVRPFRYRLPSRAKATGLEVLAAYEANR